MSELARRLKEADPHLTIISGHRRQSKRNFNACGGFREFCHLRQALAEIKLSHFDDDAEFLVKVGKALPLREKVRAPSQIVLEHALWRAGIEGAKISRVG